MTAPHTPKVPEPTGHDDAAPEPTQLPQQPDSPAPDMAGSAIADLDARTSRLDYLSGHATPAKHSPGRGLSQGAGTDGTGPAGVTGFVREARPNDLPAIGTVHAASMLASLEAGHRSAHGTDLPEGVRAMVAPPVVATGWQEAVTSPPSPDHHVLVATQEGTVVGLLGLAPTRSVGTQPLAPDSSEPGRADSSEPGGTDSTGADGTGSVATGRTGSESVVPAAAGTKPPALTDANRSQVPPSLPVPRDSRPTENRASLPAAEVTALGVDPAYQRRGHGSRLLAAAADTARDRGARALVVWAVRGDDSLARFLRSVGLAPTGAHRGLPVGQGVTEDCWVAQL
ncbi:GNAT family N-acetyltransferase [Actinomyces lilanjuaniae]|nr:GNAT family N-acetyltransferase [Actinomyces lilanjuaniae]